MYGLTTRSVALEVRGILVCSFKRGGLRRSKFYPRKDECRANGNAPVIEPIGLKAWEKLRRRSELSGSPAQR